MTDPIDLDIRPATGADVPALVETQVRAFRDDGRQFHPEGRQDGPPGYDSAEWQRWIMERGRYFAICSEGRIVGGMIVFEIGQGTMNLGRIWVDLDAQGRGVGRAAIEWLHRNLAAQKWTLETPAWAVRNHHLYESLGYRKVGEREDPDVPEYLYER
jgi:RimJ/RimL family protein N-acetyltransferase